MEIEESKQKLEPWEMKKSLVEIVESIDMEIIGEVNEKYLVGCCDSDCQYFDVEIPKNKFKELPHQVKVGTHCWLVIYKMKGQKESKISLWPVASYWHKSW